MNKTIVAIIVYSRFENIERWIKCWHKCDQTDAELVVIQNTDARVRPDQIRALCEVNNIQYFERKNIGMDIGAFKDVCEKKIEGFPDFDNLLWITDDVIPMSKDFVSLFTRSLKGLNCLEIANTNAPLHVRTTGFCITKEVAERLVISDIRTKIDCYRFEHRGADTLMLQVNRMGLECVQLGPIEKAKEMSIKLFEEKHGDITKVIEGLQKDFNEKMKAQKEAMETEIKVKLDEKDKKIDEALTKMNRIQEKEKEARAKTLHSSIYDSLGDHEERLKNWSHDRKAFSIEMKEVAVVGVPAGSVAPEFQEPVGIAHEMVHARNAIPVSPTSSNLIKYVQFTKKEGAINSIGAGVEKPGFDWTVTPKEAPVRKIAGHITVQDEFLEDIAGARSFLAAELPQAYLDAEDLQIFKGDSDVRATDIDGLFSVHAEALVLPKGTVTTASNTWDKIAAGLTQIRRNLRAASAIWLSPEDYMELLINKGTTDMYTYPIIADANGQLRIGGVPIFQHSVFAEGEGLAGDFVRGTRIFQKMGMVIKFSTEHDVNFTSNLTTILIEARIALPVYFPESFVKFDFGTTT